MTWTRFMDMHSGGGLKEKFGYCYIEAPEAEAKVIFYNRFSHSPDRVSCTCCGADYSIDGYPTLEAATAFERGCRWAEDERGWLWGKHRPKDYRDGRYLEPDEAVPFRMRVSNLSLSRDGRGMTVAEWRKRGKGNLDGGVLFIDAAHIKASERVGELPEQDYVWKD